MERKVFTHVVANVVLAVLVVAIASIGFFGATANVFNSNDSPIYRGTGDKQVSLMINVYWGTEYLDDMLAIFDKYGVSTTFFVGGSWVAQYPDMLKKIYSYGHEIGNHGYNHKDQGSLSYDANVKEITTCGKLVFEYIGINMTLFAPPSGDFNNDTLAAARDNGYKTIMWSRDTIDWRDKDKDTVFSRATKDTSSGELILMHPTKHTRDALEEIVRYYLDKGFSIVPVSTNLGALWTSSNNTQAD
ncbi:MAG: polysaccharide deacetylase family protein [Clostridiales bacterium]|nr:polysaccharide deacetylase family protein [Clostridiales bacterium]